MSAVWGWGCWKHHHLWRSSGFEQQHRWLIKNRIPFFKPRRASCRRWAALKIIIIKKKLSKTLLLRVFRHGLKIISGILRLPRRQRFTGEEKKKKRKKKTHSVAVCLFLCEKPWLVVGGAREKRRHAKERGGNKWGIWSVWVLSEVSVPGTCYRCVMMECWDVNYNYP